MSPRERQRPPTVSASFQVQVRSGRCYSSEGNIPAPPGQTTVEPVDPSGFSTKLLRVQVLLEEVGAFLAIIPSHDLVLQLDLTNGVSLVPTLRDQVYDKGLLFKVFAGLAGINPPNTTGDSFDCVGVFIPLCFELPPGGC